MYTHTSLIHAHLEVQKKYWNVFLLLVVTFVKAVNALAVDTLLGRPLSVVQGEFLLDCKTYNFFKQENAVASAESKNKT